jgi:5-methylcytosine-specific restriction endonuclease McrA
MGTHENETETEMTKTLVLNASHEPLHLASKKRAVSMVLAGKADVVETDGDIFRSEKTSVPSPSVVRLRRFVYVPFHRSVPVTTRTVLARDLYRCAYCGGRADTRDHIVPRDRGGKDEWENVVAACGRCNRKKGRRLLEELGWTLPFTPTKPLGPVAWLLASAPDPAWEQYLSA